VTAPESPEAHAPGSLRVPSLGRLCVAFPIGLPVEAHPWASRNISTRRLCLQSSAFPGCGKATRRPARGDVASPPCIPRNRASRLPPQPPRRSCHQKHAFVHSSSANFGAQASGCTRTCHNGLFWHACFCRGCRRQRQWRPRGRRPAAHGKCSPASLPPPRRYECAL